MAIRKESRVTFLVDTTPAAGYNNSKKEECLKLYQTERHDNVPYCSAAWDNFYCWPATPGGDIVSRSCKEIFSFLPATSYQRKESFAYRVCSLNGEWLLGNRTNYTECLDLVRKDPQLGQVHVAVSYILLVCSTVSVLFLSMALFIFFYFRSLQCTRLRVHRNLVGALIAHSILLIVISLPVITESSITNYRSNEFVCKTVLMLKMYTSMASINWMFLEGLLLHSRITISIFRQDAPFKMYYFVGWGVPSIFIMAWTLAMQVTMQTECWEKYGHSPFIWLITGPMIAALTVNFIFLVNIIRILVTKLKSSLTLEITQVRKAVKATALLFPLLGITHLLFCVNPGDNGRLQDAYMMTNAILQSSQGICVAILYCFCNADVQIALRKAYLRAALRRNPNRRYTWVRKGPSSQYSSTYLSHCETSITESKSSPAHKSLIQLKDTRSYKQTSNVEVKLCNECNDSKESEGRDEL